MKVQNQICTSQKYLLAHFYLEPSTSKMPANKSIIVPNDIFKTDIPEMRTFDHMRDIHQVYMAQQRLGVLIAQEFKLSGAVANPKGGTSRTTKDPSLRKPNVFFDYYVAREHAKRKEVILNKEQTHEYYKYKDTGIGAFNSLLSEKFEKNKQLVHEEFIQDPKFENVTDKITGKSVKRKASVLNEFIASSAVKFPSSKVFNKAKNNKYEDDEEDVDEADEDVNEADEDDNNSDGDDEADDADANVEIVNNVKSEEPAEETTKGRKKNKNTTSTPNRVTRSNPQGTPKKSKAKPAADDNDKDNNDEEDDEKAHEFMRDLAEDSGDDSD